MTDSELLADALEYLLSHEDSGPWGEGWQSDELVKLCSDIRVRLGKETMKRFLLFSGEVYYPLGGMDDFVGDFDTLNQAKAAHPTHRELEWAHIWDSELRKVVSESSYEVWDTVDKAAGQHPVKYVVWADK